jgi:hypothetical protein|tara:strand:+ start:16917 stop:17504 length:588 start_codon:yes stop_codon:yes gene_type:complete
MAGGGLNLLPHKSWNPYGWKQKQRVALDEEKAEAAARAEAMAKSVESFDKLRGRKSKVSGEGVSSSGRRNKHVNLFSEEERALDEAAKRDAETAKFLDESHRVGGRAHTQHVPWYVQRPKRKTDDESPFSKDDDTRERSRRRTARNETTSRERKRGQEPPPVTKRRKKPINELREERMERERVERQRTRDSIRWE